MTGLDHSRISVFVLGFEPRISRVLGERHNQARPYEQASNEDRTRDLALTKRMLCQLSYRGERRACRVCRLFDFLFLSKKTKLRNGESNPGHLRDRQRCYQLHHIGLEYLGFDPSTSCLLSTHASDCANTPEAPARCSRNIHRDHVPKKNKKAIQHWLFPRSPLPKY